MNKLASDLIRSGNPVGIVVGIGVFAIGTLCGYAIGHEQNIEEHEEVLMQATIGMEKLSAEVEEVTRENVYLKKQRHVM